MCPICIPSISDTNQVLLLSPIHNQAFGWWVVTTWNSKSRQRSPLSSKYCYNLGCNGQQHSIAPRSAVYITPWQINPSCWKPLPSTVVKLFPSPALIWYTLSDKFIWAILHTSTGQYGCVQLYRWCGYTCSIIRGTRATLIAVHSRAESDESHCTRWLPNKFSMCMC